MFGSKVVMTADPQRTPIRNGVQPACMSSELIGIISLLPRSLLHFNADSKEAGEGLCLYTMRL